MMHGTFSMTARCPRTGQFGVAVASKYLAVGAVVPFVRAGVGAVATQARGNALFGPEGLDLMACGTPPEDIIQQFTRRDSDWEYRQVHMIDAEARTACHTGAETVEWAGHRTGENSPVAGHILTGPEVLEAMLEALQADPGEPLARRLMAALQAGGHAGGDRRGHKNLPISGCLAILASHDPGRANLDTCISRNLAGSVHRNVELLGNHASSEIDKSALVRL